MEHESRATSVSPSEKTIPIDRERTIASPRFDDKSVQRARPAVPIARASRFGSSMLLVACVVAGLVGGVAGGLALMLYQKRDAGAPPQPSAIVSSEPAATPAPAAANATPSPAANDEAPPVAGRVEVVPPAPSASTPNEVSPPTEDEAAVQEAREPDGREQAELRGALTEWIAATNARDIGRQMDFYGERVASFYRTRNVPREAVRAEKARVFGNADTIDIRAAAPDVRLSRDGQTAVMRFRKKYNIEGGGQERRGEVLQELRWQRTPGGWKIVSERDLRVID